MKSLKKKKQGDTLDEFLTRVEEYNKKLSKIQDNVKELKLVQAKVCFLLLLSQSIFCHRCWESPRPPRDRST